MSATVIDVHDELATAKVGPRHWLLADHRRGCHCGSACDRLGAVCGAPSFRSVRFQGGSPRLRLTLP